MTTPREFAKQIIPQCRCPLDTAAKFLAKFPNPDEQIGGDYAWHILDRLVPEPPAVSDFGPDGQPRVGPCTRVIGIFTERDKIPEVIPDPNWSPALSNC